MASVSYRLISSGIIESLSPLFASLQVLVNIPPSSNSVNVIILPVSPLEDVEQGVYATAGRITIASE